jgi:hypothetical protein
MRCERYRNSNMQRADVIAGKRNCFFFSSVRPKRAISDDACAFEFDVAANDRTGAEHRCTRQTHRMEHRLLATICMLRFPAFDCATR